MYVFTDFSRSCSPPYIAYVYMYIYIDIYTPHVIQIQVQTSASLTASYTRDVKYINRYTQCVDIQIGIYRPFV